jgi:CDP-diglyceride synthetase
VPKKTNWGLIGGFALIGAGVIGMFVYYFWNKKKTLK